MSHSYRSHDCIRVLAAGDPAFASATFSASAEPQARLVLCHAGNRQSVTRRRIPRRYRPRPRKAWRGASSAQRGFRVLGREQEPGHRRRDAWFSGHENPSGRNRRSGRLLALTGHRGILVVENAAGHAVCGRWASSPWFSVAAPATCPGAPRARIGLCRSPTRSPSHPCTTGFRR